MTSNEAIAKIRKFFWTYRRVPTYEEMCKLFGYSSKQSVARIVEKLIKKKFLEKDRKDRITLRHPFLPLPLLRTSKTQTPQYAEEQLIDSPTFDEFLVDHPDSSYLLKVSGDSMEEAGIHDGDIVIVEKGKKAKEKDIVVVMIDETFTLKYLKKIKGKYCLVAANPKYQDIYPKESLVIEGVVVSLIRKYR